QPAWGSVDSPAVDDVVWFTPATERFAGPQTVLNNLDSTRSRHKVIQVAAEALAAEGPILLARLVTHVARCFDYTRLGARKRTDLETIFGTTFGTDDHGFVWPANTDRESPLPVRRTPKGARTPAEIHPNELVTTLDEVLRAACSADRRELTSECARALGIHPSGAFTTVFDPVVDHAVATGRVEVTDDRYRLA
ncbi:MAG: hypothetical protein FWD11_05435, partial [Micrococcales bacterium]|nr:hypothetical protein [Micrococcales bacterium]